MIEKAEILSNTILTGCISNGVTTLVKGCYAACTVKGMRDNGYLTGGPEERVKVMRCRIPNFAADKAVIVYCSGIDWIPSRINNRLDRVTLGGKGGVRD